MEQHEYKAYLVIKIPRQNRNDRERYECIPSSWVKLTDDDDDNIVVFGYPLEDRINTRLRVIEYEPLDNTWPTLYGEMVLNTDSQDVALRYVEGKINELKSDINHSNNINNKVVEVITPKEIKLNLIKPSSQESIHSSKPKEPDHESIFQNATVSRKLRKEVNLEIIKAHESIRTYTMDLDNEDTSLFSPLRISNNNQILEPTKILPNETNDEAMKETTVNKEDSNKIMTRPRRKSTCQKISYLEISEDEFDDDESNCASEIVDAASNAVIHNSPQSGILEESIPVVVNNSLDHQDINMNLLDDSVHSYLYSFYVDLNESYQKIMASFDNAADYVQKIITTRKENVEVNADLSSPLSTDTESVNSVAFSHPALLQERQRVSSEDNKSTLKYTKKEQGTIELLPNTGVYVSENGLNMCKSTFNTTTKFTCGLLDEVFTEKALKTCTFAGRLGKKPGLNVNARETIVNYVLNYALERKWEKADPTVIITCIKNRLARSKQKKK